MGNFYKTLEVALTEEEQLQIAVEITETQAKIDEIESLKKALPGLRSRMSELSKQFTKKVKFAEVECYQVMDDPAPGQKTIYRVDNADLVEVLDMKDTDLQVELELPLNPDGEVEPTIEQGTAPVIPLNPGVEEPF